MSAPLRLPRVRAARLRPAAPAPTRIGVIGAGRAGRALAAALTAAGHEIVAVASRTPAAAHRLAADLAVPRPAADPAVPRPAADLAAAHPDSAGRAAAPPAPAVLAPAPAVLAPAPAVLAPAAVAARAVDLLVLAVPDGALADVVALVAPAVRPGQVVAHLSGAHGTAVLAPVLARGADALALHPAMTLTGDPADAGRLRAGVTFGVTASAGAAALAARLVDDLGGRIEWIAEADRVRYHAALAHGANHLVTLVNDAVELARRAGVADPATLLAPLLRAALDNVLAHGDAALTGPVARGDAATVRAHLADLDRTAPALAPAYRALARRTADRTAADRDPAAAAALRAALADPPPTPAAPGASAATATPAPPATPPAAAQAVTAPAAGAVTEPASAAPVNSGGDR
ncbi:hypothetical protein GCM10010124_00830 [Pilimelia terevasa]|uniref:DUF2520 domain-containing protein n=1 Tax=Pilimelia terevasa TaxID=53372 RepID=A0A8J3BI89_9ACTN|nr:Rossmann-like and DUF2520 domain-containing protein [Pilimelia terevasa]GGK12072.1 hypothetical protein GCM10010124_00830 [Pilimelia terevasa]